MVALSKYVSQFHPASWRDYKGPEISPEEEAAMKENLRRWIQTRDGIPIEGFRHYSGLPDNIGR